MCQQEQLTVLGSTADGTWFLPSSQPHHENARVRLIALVNIQRILGSSAPLAGVTLLRYTRESGPSASLLPPQERRALRNAASCPPCRRAPWQANYTGSSFLLVVLRQVIEISESGFYVWQMCPVCQRKQEEVERSSHIRQIFVSPLSSQGKFATSCRPSRPRVLLLAQAERSLDACTNIGSQPRENGSVW